MKFDIIEQMRWESNLNPGDQVQARWTNCGRFMHGQAAVVRVNRSSIRVRLLEHVQAEHGGWPVGHELVIPLTTAPRLWSLNNCVLPRLHELSGKVVRY